jgi:hypothetical protein
MVVCLLALGGQAFAEMCSIDAVPAATLLLPYFEVDWSVQQGAGVNTIFSVNNASAVPTLGHVVVWSNWSVPLIDFDIYLTGYDVVVFNVWELFQGNIPITADAPNDPIDSISPDGGAVDPPDVTIPPGWSDNDHWDDTDAVAAGKQGFPFCGNFFPFFINPVITSNAYDRLTNGCSGVPVASLSWACGVSACCAGAPCPGGAEACGYITIDDARECSLILDPRDITYFVDGGLGIATDDNQLWGDYYIIDPLQNYAFGDTLVHIEADPLFDGLPTNYTFYGRYVLGDGRDDREPLGTTWASRYLNGGPFSGGTDLIVWRDSTDNNPFDTTGHRCDPIGPPWYPLNETEVIVFNEWEDAVEICYFTGGIISPPETDDPACFPLETGRYALGVNPLDIPYDFGWIYLNLNLPPDTLAAPSIDVDFPLPDGLLAQSYVTSQLSALGLYSVGLSAIELTDACEDLNPVINGAAVNGGVNIIQTY